AKGHDVMFGVRDPQEEKVRETIKETGGKARAGAVKESAAFGDVVVMATPWPATHEAIQSAGNLTGKVVVDCTNPLAPDLSGLVVGMTDSAGEEVARWAKGARVVKAFNTIGAPNFGNPKFGSENATMFICGDSEDAKLMVAKLASELGFDVVDAGPLTASRMLEPLAMLWIHLAFKQGLGPTGHAFKLLRR
ncbi:MAG TPA: NAD(P)-binding domain-containing protein, partial [Terriglobia bacterium]|nr:NAD(P)-binding domain-containing protein [Terriglobia bacterium]